MVSECVKMGNAKGRTKLIRCDRYHGNIITLSAVIPSVASAQLLSLCASVPLPQVQGAS